MISKLKKIREIIDYWDRFLNIEFSRFDDGEMAIDRENVSVQILPSGEEVKWVKRDGVYYEYREGVAFPDGYEIYDGELIHFKTIQDFIDEVKNL